MIQFERHAIEEISRSAETEYPNECCGMIAGTRKPDGTVAVTQVVPSRNMATDNVRDSFEVDPQVRFDLMRELSNAGNGTDIVGHYHSHPNHPAKPSARDLAMAYEPDLIWVIVSVGDNGVVDIRAHSVLPGGSAFQETPLHIVGVGSYSSTLATSSTPTTSNGDIAP